MPKRVRSPSSLLSERAPSPENMEVFERAQVTAALVYDIDHLADPHVIAREIPYRSSRRRSGPFVDAQRHPAAIRNPRQVAPPSPVIGAAHR